MIKTHNGNGQHVDLQDERMRQRELGRENKAPLMIHWKPEGIILARGEDCFFIPNSELSHLRAGIEHQCDRLGRTA